MPTDKVARLNLRESTTADHRISSDYLPPASGPSRADRPLQWIAENWPYILAIVLPAVVVALLRQVWITDVYLTGDSLWEQSMLQVAAQAGPFGATDHTAYPFGNSLWTNPQMGLLFGTAGWLGVGLLGFSSAVVYNSMFVLAAGLCGAATMWMLRAVVPPRGDLVAVALAVCVTTAAIGQGTVNIALWVIVPLVFGVLLRWSNSAKNRRRKFLWLIAATAIILPLHWSMVLLAVLPVGAAALAFNRQWVDLRGLFWVLGMLGIGFGIQAALYAVAFGPASETQRYSTNFALGGNFGGLLTDSPILSGLAPTVGPTMSGLLNTPLVLLSIATVLASIGVLAGRSGDVRRAVLLSSWSLVFLLFWLSGGLWTAQALLLEWLGMGHPLRVWARLVFILGLLGALWVLVALESLAAREWYRAGRGWVIAGSVAVVFTAVAVLEAFQIPLVDLRPGDAPLAPAARFVAANTSPCPVAQLPVEQMFENAINVRGGVFPTHYDPLYPYLAEPQHFWSYGSYRGGQPVAENPLAGLPKDLQRSDLSGIWDAGYCAVLYEKAAGAAAQEQGDTAPGVRLPGSVVPDYEDEYAVVLLNPQSAL